MAKTIDEVVLKTSVEGLAALEQANISFNKMDDGIRKINTTLNSFTVRNVAYQIQDIAVQAEMGTNAFRIFTQQAPQLLSAFGTVGTVIGAVAAITLPLLQYGLKLAGVDMRSLEERTRDFTSTVEKLKAAQTANLPTTAGLGAAYGDLAETAKKYLDSVEKLATVKSATELQQTLDKILSNFTQAGTDLQNILETAQGISFEDAAMSASVLGAGVALLAIKTGLSSENAEILSNKLKQLNRDSKPEDVVKVVEEINSWLVSTGLESAKVLRVMEEVVKPLNDAAQAALKMKENVAKTSQAASELSAILTGIQNKFLPDINDARRNFDQITAIRLEGSMKADEFEKQVKNRRDKGEIVTAQEIAATKLRISQDTNDKEKDFLKTQQEAYYAQQLSNEAKLSQLQMQGKINELQLGQVDAINYQSIAEEATLKNVHEQQQALLAIEELRRKNQITEERAERLREQAAQIRKQQDDNAEQAAIRIALENQRAIRIQLEGLAFSNYQKEVALELEQKGFLLSSRGMDFSKKLQDLQERRYMTEQDIQRNSRLSDDEKQQALEKINKLYDDGVKILRRERDYRLAIDESYSAGALDRLKQIQESFTPFKQGGMIVDSVFNQMSSSIDKFVETGKFSFSDFTRSVIFDIEKILLKAAAINFLKAGASAMGFAIPGLASGGGVQGGSPYLVGEQGPELFIPSGAGSIVPNSRMGGMAGNTYITNNISAIDSKSVAQLFAENRRTLFGNVEQARRELPMRTR